MSKGLKIDKSETYPTAKKELDILRFPSTSLQLRLTKNNPDSQIAVKKIPHVQTGKLKQTKGIIRLENDSNKCKYKNIHHL